MARRAKQKDIDHVLRAWDYDPGEISVRLVQAADGRDVLQMRVDMGILQLETENRPDGWRPSGCESYFDYLVGLTIHEGDDFSLDEDQCTEADRELAQFYHRRICWLALREYRRAMRDADHNLAFMDFLREIAPNQEWLATHEQYRPFVLFHRTQAGALAALEESSPEQAIEEVNLGLNRLKDFFEQHDAAESYEDDEMVRRLIDLRETLREQYSVGPTLNEKLAEAIAGEQYELAAKLRDEIAQRDKPSA